MTKPTDFYSKQFSEICEEFDRVASIDPTNSIAQFKGESCLFMQFIINHLPHGGTFVEIGSLVGRNFVFMGNVLSKFGGTYGISIDHGKNARLVGTSLAEQINKCGPVFDYNIILKNSHDTVARQDVESLLKIQNKEKADLLLIDGDHTYNGCLNDFDMYNSIVRKGGIVAIDDIRNGDDGVGGVWKRLKKDFRYREFSILENRKGIGVLYV